MTLGTGPCPPLGSDGKHPRKGKRAPLTTVLVTAGQSCPSPAPSSCGQESLAKVTEEVPGRARAEPTSDSKPRAPSCTDSQSSTWPEQLLLHSPGLGISNQLPGPTAAALQTTCLLVKQGSEPALLSLNSPGQSLRMEPQTVPCPWFM